MILADTSVWIDHLRKGNRKMKELLDHGQIAVHPLIVAEIALGSLRNRQKRLAEMDALTRWLTVANLEEVRRMIEDRSLYSRGIGLVDAHLLASCLMTPGTRLWTLDTALGKVSKDLGIRVDPV